MKRTPLTRRTQLRVVTPLQRSRPLARDRAPRPKTPGTARPWSSTQKRRRDTGPTAAVRELVLDRAEGCCEIGGEQLHDGSHWVAEHSFHHRRPRRMGGTSDPATNGPANLLLLCGSATSPRGCHLLVESQRVLALANGWLLHAGDDPTKVEVDLHRVPLGHRARLDDDGGITINDGDSSWRL